MNDPADRVPQQLLPHVHLLSNFQWPSSAHLSAEKIVDYLLQAPSITRNTAPMTWSFIDTPLDGSILLVWHPTRLLRSHFATDGYAWADNEQAHVMETKGCTLEMFIHRSGFKPSHEAATLHTRRRYRLTSTRSAHPNAQFDPSLWLVHYTASESENRIPVQRVGLPPPVQKLLQERSFYRSQGQLVRKEFMLHDRNNWPTVSLPSAPMPRPELLGRAGQTFSSGTGTIQPRAAHAIQARPAHGPSAAKRQRHHGPAHDLIGGGRAAGANLDEDEESGRGDALDHLTPRELSGVRYKQHHEWMEEIMSTPYTIGQIVPADLGLGRKGALEALTDGFFDAPTSERPQQQGGDTGASFLGAGKADDFKQRAAEYVAGLHADMEKMKKKQAKRMDKIRKGDTIKSAERRLRYAVIDPDKAALIDERPVDSESKKDDSEMNHNHNATRRKEKIDDIVQDVEKATGMVIVDAKMLSLVQPGGLEAKPTSNGTPAEHGRSDDSTGHKTGSHELEQSNADLTPEASQSMPAMPQPASTDTLQSMDAPMAPNIPAVESATGPSMALAQGSEVVLPQPSDMDVDVEMASVMDDALAPADEMGAVVGESEDWIMVAKSGHDGVGELPNVPTSTVGAEEKSTQATSAMADAGGSALEPADGLLDPTQFGEFGNLDSAGDALQSYGGQGELSLDDSIGLDLDTSAFGDALHGTEGHDGQEGS
ncbi:MAG: hypothetical protein M1817_002105 [Caeruleum heppii]|nr:MAG: hypothetical protein M1817_002105 [Caeruleum heppii]